MFSIFIFMTVFAQIANQIAPFFCDSRTLYEARERPSKAYSWKAFMASNFVVELAWNSVSAQLKKSFDPSASADHIISV